jgi:hypothetical protein
MPRQTLVINDFSGGLCDAPDRRDLKDNELYQLQDACIDSGGRIILMGASTSSLSPASFACNATSGLGSIIDRLVANGETRTAVFTFGSDYTLGSSATSKNLYVIIGEDTSGTSRSAGMVLLDYNGAALTTNTNVVLSAWSTNHSTRCTHAFYVYNNAVRICIGDTLDSATSRQIIAYNDRPSGEGTDIIAPYSSYTYATWYAKVNVLTAPVAGECVVHTSSQITADDTVNSNETVAECTSALFTARFGTYNYWVVNATHGQARVITSSDSDSITTSALSGGYVYDDDDIRIYPPTGGTRFTIYPAWPTASIGTWPAKTYAFGASFIYRDEQESAITYFQHPVGGIDLTANDALNIIIRLTPPYGPDIIGGRIYCRESTEVVSDWYLVCEMDFQKGYRLEPTYDWTTWVTYQAVAGSSATATDFCLGGSTSAGLCNKTFYEVEVQRLGPSAVTYQILNGYNSDELITTGLQYKTAIIANGCAYVANIRYNKIVYNDTILKSMPGKVDTFIFNRRLDLTRGDGEEIIKLESFADRLLVFKTRTLYVVNISQESEFVEDIYPFRGCTHPSLVCKTEFGIVWGNQYGCYLYDGKEVIDLLMDFQDRTRRKISLTTWTGIILSAYYPQMGYDAVNKLLIIAKYNQSVSGALATDILRFDFNNLTWSYGKEKIANGAGYMSNLFTDLTGRLSFFRVTDPGAVLYTWEIMKWDNTPAGTSYLAIKTKDFDIQQPGIKKGFYSVILTHRRTANDNAVVSIALDGSDTFSTASLATSAILTNNSSWLFQKWQITTATGRDRESITIQISTPTSAVGSSFTVNDISVHYRLKGSR